MPAHAKLIIFFKLAFVLFVFTSCGLYTSSDRKKFETDNPNPPAMTAKDEVLKTSNCSQNSLADRSSIQEIIYEYDNGTEQSLIVRRLVINGIEVFESDDLQGVYCVLQPEPNS